jgi:Na+/H+ antiporter NhaD/arsenite permease-like protein
MGLLSAFLVNDTVAILGVSVIAFIIKQIKNLNPQILLIGLAFGISIGSTMTPIGNPQNLLISIQSGIDTPLTKFLIILGPPTIISLSITTVILKFYFKKQLIPNIEKQQHTQQQQYHQKIHNSLNDLDANNQIEYVNKVIRDKNFAKISILVLFITIIGFILSEILFYLKIADIELSIIALLGAGLLYSLTK